MTQTTGGMSMRNAVIEISTDGAAWTDISGVANKVEPGGNERKSGEAYTADGDRSIVTVGKQEPLEVKGALVYSEVPAEAYTLMEGYFQAATPVYLRWAPAGSAPGNYQYTTDLGYITQCAPPGGDVDKGDPILVDFTHKSPGYSQAAMGG